MDTVMIPLSAVLLSVRATVCLDTLDNVIDSLLPNQALGGCSGSFPSY